MDVVLATPGDERVVAVVRVHLHLQQEAAVGVEASAHAVSAECRNLSVMRKGEGAPRLLQYLAHRRRDGGVAQDVGKLLRPKVGYANASHQALPHQALHGLHSNGGRGVSA